MAVYYVIDISIHDLENYKKYVGLVPALIEKHGGKYLVRGAEAEIKEGDWKPERLVVLEFPTREQATSFFDDPEYQPVAAIRRAASTTRMVLVDGYEG